MRASDVNPQQFKLFLFETIDKEHWPNAFFTQMLLRACFNSYIGIFDNPNIDFTEDLLQIRDNMKQFRLLGEKTNSTCNGAPIPVIYLLMLCYACNKRSNMMQRVVGQFVFAHNISKRFVKAFHQMGLMVSYESIYRDLNINAQAIMDTIVDKTRTSRFFSHRSI